MLVGVVALGYQTDQLVGDVVRQIHSQPLVFFAILPA